MAVCSTLDSSPARAERVQKSFTDFGAQLALLDKCTSEWKALEDYFSHLERTVQDKFQELSKEEAAFEDAIKEAKESLDRRGNAVFSREQASLQRVRDQKDSAIAAILEERQKWIEERRAKPASEVAAATLATANNAATPISASNGDDKRTLADSSASKLSTETSDVPVFKDPVTDRSIESLRDVPVRPQLRILCNNMDGQGLTKYLADNRKEKAELRLELPSALLGAVDPCRLVLKALEDYHTLELDPNPSKENRASVIRRACISLLEALAPVIADPVLGMYHPVVPFNIKEIVKEVARRWKSKMDIRGDFQNVSALDAFAFLQLLATFGITSEYKADFLCKLVITVAQHKQAPSLCRSLGLTTKVPDVVDQLDKEGKQLEALTFAHAFGIMGKMQPVQMLKEYLKEVRKAAQISVKKAPDISAGKNEAVVKELSAVKAVLKAIEEYKLEGEFPTVGLLRRAEQLEKSKADRKRQAAEKLERIEAHKRQVIAVQLEKEREQKRQEAEQKAREERKREADERAREEKKREAEALLEKVNAERKREAAAVQMQAKRPRPGDSPGTGFTNASATAFVGPGAVNSADKATYLSLEDAWHGGTVSSSYAMSGAGNYNQQRQAGLGTPYIADNRNPLSLPSSYPSDRTDSMRSSSAYPNLAGTYAAYQYSKTAPPPSTHQSFIH
eukprot:c27569_g1_i1 orf=426-2462(-)